ncbi:DUF4279 domain-containing protein [Aquipuribacter nitratireducens]|uniref:DUF4279 domain-containing protein n=1 Tax=Aquipuribacter nitratireducens TaxID=650104 RepID=A0ABW0GTL6_9MICO
MVTFRLWGDGSETAGDLAERLGVPSDDAAAGGDAVGRGRRESLWSIASGPRPEDDVELTVQLHRVMDRLEPVAEALWEFVRAGHEANWFCYVGSHSLEHAVELDRGTLQRLLTLPGELWLDVYPDDAGDVSP